MSGTVTIHGREYVTVAARVQAALATAGKYEMVSSDVLPLGNTGRFYVRVIVRVDGRQYVGTAEAHLEAPKNTPDGANPIETAETSALGRALGFAGYGSVESIASADEVVRSEQRQQTQPQAQKAQPQAQKAQPQAQKAQPQAQKAQPQAQKAQPQASRPAQNVQKAMDDASQKPSAFQVKAIQNLCTMLKRDVPEATTQAEAAAIIHALNAQLDEARRTSVN